MMYEKMMIRVFGEYKEMETDEKKKVYMNV